MKMKNAAYKKPMKEGIKKMKKTPMKMKPAKTAKMGTGRA